MVSGSPGCDKGICPWYRGVPGVTSVSTLVPGSPGCQMGFGLRVWESRLQQGFLGVRIYLPWYLGVPGVRMVSGLVPGSPGCESGIGAGTWESRV